MKNNSAEDLEKPTTTIHEGFDKALIQNKELASADIDKDKGKQINSSLKMRTLVESYLKQKGLTNYDSESFKEDSAYLKTVFPYLPQLRSADVIVSYGLLIAHKGDNEKSEMGLLLIMYEYLMNKHKNCSNRKAVAKWFYPNYNPATTSVLTLLVKDAIKELFKGDPENLNTDTKFDYYQAAQTLIETELSKSALIKYYVGENDVEKANYSAIISGVLTSYMKIARDNCKPSTFLSLSN